MTLTKPSSSFQRKEADRFFWEVLPEEEGQRLDHVLERLMPEVGLRGRRRACSLNLVMVNGLPRKESFKVRTGDRVEIAPSLLSSPYLEKQDFSENPRVLKRYPSLAFLYKPAGLHSVSLAGRPEPCLEQFLSRLLKTPGAKLLNRLDFPTSGIVAAALNSQGEALYHREEDLGHVKKYYLALLEGKFPQTTLADIPLDGNGREKVRILPGCCDDPLRQTTITPLAWLKSAEFPLLRAQFSVQREAPPSILTLACCSIKKGARHQIRAHCAALGFPLAGDRRYGACFCPKDSTQERFFLHNTLLVFPDMRIHAEAPWLSLLEKESKECARRIKEWITPLL